MGFRFGEDGTDSTDEAPAPAKVDTPAAIRKPVRTTKRKAAAATA